ncbi:histidinol dehydrogenase [bacterium]|nr:histidinol dehydrogenase [bacterium]
MSEGKVQIIDVRRQSSALLDALRQRSLADVSPEVEQAVREIVDRVRAEGDAALLEYGRRFDCPTLELDDLRVPDQELEAAYADVSPEWIGAFRRAKENIYAFHERLRPTSWLDSFDGMWLGQKVTPLAAVGLYVPAAKAPLPSTVAMTAVPARVAGVTRLVLATPPRRDGTLDPTMLVAAAECGVDEVYRMGGAQAVAALAYGTDTVERVDKVVGPGNPYVILAKREVFGVVGIESLPGPSESLIIADGEADPVLVAADLLSQAEHTGDNLVILLTPDQTLAEAVRDEAYRQLMVLPRMELTSASLGDYGVIAIVQDLDHAVQIANDIAPEHLELSVAEPLELLERVENAGCICLGHMTSVPLADYAAGPSHVLPTNGTARFSSPLSVEDFVKKSSLVYATECGLQSLGPDVAVLAEGEGLYAHAEAVKRRLR